MMEEAWKAVEANKNYMVSSMGRIKSLERYVNAPRGGKRKVQTKIMVPVVHSSGYIIVKMGRKTYTVHTLVAKAFINPCYAPLVVNHKDGNKANNILSNLEIISQSENHKHAHKFLGKTPWAKGLFGAANPVSKPVLMLKDGVAIREYASGMDAVRDGFDSSAITKCCKGKLRMHRGFQWKYAEGVKWTEPKDKRA
jgi:hypothetical protein